MVNTILGFKLAPFRKLNNSLKTLLLIGVFWNFCFDNLKHPQRHIASSNFNKKNYLIDSERV